MRKILHFVHVRAPVTKVYAALTTEKGLAGWWSTRVRARPEVGSVADFTFLEGFNPDMEITALEPDRRVEWRCVGGHDNWRDNTFSFALDERDGGTGLMFVQHYARELDDETYGNYNYNWGFYLLSLKKLCETGSGTPHRAAE